MSAKVIELYEVRCDECGVTSWPSESEAQANGWAANHDAENHAEDDGNDDAYEKFKESRK